jgi:hypothetical protein
MAATHSAVQQQQQQVVLLPSQASWNGLLPSGSCPKLPAHWQQSKGERRQLCELL